MRKPIISVMIVFLIFYIKNSFSQGVPEILYYRFYENSASSTPNYAVTGRGSLMAQLISQSFGSGGQFDSCLVGTGGTNKYLNTGWATNFGTGNWTISLWINNIADLNPTYLFGDITTNGDFRCFYGGAAGTNNLLLRGPFQDVLVTNVMPGPTVIHFVYDGSSITVYKNGTYYNSFPRPGINISGSGPFKVGGYGTGQQNSLNPGGRISEFRVYGRALSATEISITWNHSLGSWLPSNSICKNGINKIIPSDGRLDDTINVNSIPSDVCLTSLMVRIDTLIYPHDGDLIFRLTHNNTSLNLIYRAGNNGSNFLKTNVSDTNVCYIGSLGCNIAPFAGCYKTQQGDSLAKFKFSNSNGPWVLSVTDTASGNTGVLKAWCIVINYTICTGINNNNYVPKVYSLEQNYPNPFNPSTKIKYSLPKASFVSIKVYDVLGRMVKQLVNEYKEAGSYTLTFSAENLESGVYFYKIDAGEFRDVRKMAFVK